MRVFVDTNILLDVIAKRSQFYSDSSAIWTLSETKKIEGVIAAVSFTNVYYIVRRLADKRKALAAMRMMLAVFSPASTSRNVLEQAMGAEFKDFEDAVQYFCALEAGADVIVSRNATDFPIAGSCPVLTPAEFLAAHFPSN